MAAKLPTIMHLVSCIPIPAEHGIFEKPFQDVIRGKVLDALTPKTLDFEPLAF
jgi:hypothetical protein